MNCPILVLIFFFSGFDTRKEYFQYVLLEDSDLNQDPCHRKCVLGEPPMICRYHFSLEWYDILSKACYDCPNNPDDCFRPDCVPGDGIKRAILVVNRKLPGPAIHVCNKPTYVEFNSCVNYVPNFNYLLWSQEIVLWRPNKQTDSLSVAKLSVWSF